MKKLLLILVDFYAKISPFGGRCRFYPSCSAYAREALEKHGLFKALGLTVKRVLRCNQFFPGGYDPVP
ncbi:MAG: membrane protein insertion efficiency factor YidD [Candidatus Margulisiibacteriota bacterium]